METGQQFFERVIEPIYEHMIRTVWRITRHGDDAEDALQTALEAILRRRPQVAAHPNPRALALRMCANAAWDVVRRRRRWTAFELKPDAVASGSPAVPESLDRQRTTHAVMQAIAALPASQSTALTLRVLEDQSYPEIAQALGCREATARAHVRRAREQLTRQFPDWSAPGFEEKKP